jgi:hypothetical protein
MIKLPVFINITQVPILPRQLQTYQPTNPVATIPLKLDHPPVPLLSADKLGFFMVLTSVEYVA